MFYKSMQKATRLRMRFWLSGIIVTGTLILIQGITYLWLRSVSVTLIAIGLFLIIQKLAVDRQRLLSLVSFDGLTGLGNFRAYQERMRLETVRALRNRAPLTLILIDLDRFKNYNDSYGHRLGNELLYSVGKVFQGAVRSVDGVYRYGGDEFAIVLPETDVEAAQQIVKRIRHSFEILPKRAEVTLSMGMGIYRQEPLGEFFDRVDQILYDVKANGGNGCQTELSGNPALKLTYRTAMQRGK